MSRNTSLQMSHHAEGSPDGWERREPSNPLKTSTVPAVYDTAEAKTGDTGSILVVNLNAEGEDDVSTDGQDASLTKEETKAEMQTDPTANHDYDTSRPILIVEDTVELAEVIQATLEGMGLTAEYATHGEHGMERLKALDPQILLLDIGLPDISGWKMLDMIKAHYDDDEDAMPTVIIITAYGDPANRLIGKLQNIHSYLIKPFTPDQVEHIVRMALQGKKPDNPEIGGEETNH